MTYLPSTHIGRFWLVALLALGVVGCEDQTMAVEPNNGMNQAESITEQSPDSLMARAETLQPAELYMLAANLMGAGRTDEAVKWFYIGQLRYRFHLAATQPPPGSNDRVLFSALSESVGRPINEYAFGDVDAAVAQIDGALAWDEANDNGFTSKTRYSSELAETRNGLQAMRDDMIAKKDEIRTIREKNGLPNR